MKLNLIKYMYCVTLSFVLISCGGGGSSSSNTSAQNSIVFCSDSSCNQPIASTSITSTLNVTQTKNLYIQNKGNQIINSFNTSFNPDMGSVITLDNSQCINLSPNDICEFSLTLNSASVINGTTNITFTTESNASNTLAVIYSVLDTTESAFVMGYFPNYYGYFNNNSAGQSSIYGHAIAEPSYVIPGTGFSFPAYLNGAIQPTTQDTQNQDLQNKLAGLDALTYGFFTLESSGSIKFSDPTSDLLGNSSWTAPDPKVQQLYDLPLGHKMIAVGASPATLGSTVHYGQFDAFINLQKPNGNLIKFISLGGWSGANWESNLSSTNQINTFIQSVGELRSVYNFDGLDFDIENSPDDFTDITAYINYCKTSFMQLIAGLHAAYPDLKISITIQADPTNIITPLGTTLQQNESNFTQLNLMTYDFNGAFNYSGSSGITGFNSNLYLESGDITLGQFSIDAAVSAIQQYLPLNMVTIGMPAYGRAAITGVGSTNGGLFQQFGDAQNSIVLPGDLDNTQCVTALGNQGGTTCSGTFEYRYIMNNMIGKGFTQTDWTQNGVYNGTTAYANSWTSESGLTINGVASVGIATNYPAGPHNNVFISYIDGKVANSYGSYTKNKGLKGAILWDVMGDMPYTDTTNSLIYNFRQGYTQ